jgi:6-phosphofructokinase 1
MLDFDGALGQLPCKSEPEDGPIDRFGLLLLLDDSSLHRIANKWRNRLTIQRIGLLTSGGDASGMNAVIRSVVRTGLSQRIEVIGFYQGYLGLVHGRHDLLDSKFVSGTLYRGGTILQSARCEEFKGSEGQRRALKTIDDLGIQGMIVVGGDGSLRGARVLHRRGVPTIGIPATIDNDVYGTDMAIGVDTSLTAIVHAVDMIKETASSHQRAFIIEVMGRGSGYLALMSAIASGAEAAIIPEYPSDIDVLVARLRERYQEGRTNCIIIVAEGASSAYGVAEQMKDRIGFETRVTVLGHLQRGGTPSVFDRLLGSRLGINATERLLIGDSGKMVGLVGNKTMAAPLEDVLSQPKTLDLSLLEVADILAL